jgi:hypothetical protein
MSAVFVREAAKSCPQLIQKVVRFNLHPASTLHRDHIPSGLSSEVFNRLAQSPRGERHLSGWIAREYGLSPDGFWRFEYPPQRLALLDPPVLLDLVRYSAAALCHRSMTALIGGSTLRDVKQFLGEQAYHFALKRAALVVGPASAEQSPLRGSLSALALAASGVSCLRTCLGGDAPELLRRTSLKLPAAMAISVETPVAAMDRDRCWRIIRRILLTEIAPEVAPCFN